MLHNPVARVIFFREHRARFIVTFSPTARRTGRNGFPCVPLAGCLAPCASHILQDDDDNGNGNKS